MPDCLTSELPFRLVGGLSTGGVYALIAIGYTLVYGVLQLINFAHSEVFMVGVLAGFLFLTKLVPGGAPTQVTGAGLLLAALIPAMLMSGFSRWRSSGWHTVRCENAERQGSPISSAQSECRCFFSMSSSLGGESGPKPTRPL